MVRSFVVESSWPWFSATMPLANSGQVLYDVNHLQGLKMVGDNTEGFHNTWNMVMSELASRPAEETLQLVDYNQIKGFKPMAADIAHYLRAQWNTSPEHCFQWLWDAACRYISQRRQDYMQDVLTRASTTATTMRPLHPTEEERVDRGSPNGRATRGSLGRLLRIVRLRVEVGGAPRAHLVEGPPIRAARVRTRLTRACVTPSRRALAPGGRLADFS